MVYYRHGPTELFSLITSPSSRSSYDGKYAYVPALEDVLVWDLKRGEQSGLWHSTGLTSEVTCIAESPVKNQDGNPYPKIVAVGYEDGSVRIWRWSPGSAGYRSGEVVGVGDGEVVVTFNGHQKAVTSLAFDEEGARLASGGRDTDIVIWDVVAEVGLVRLKGHRDQITQLQFFPVPESSPTSSSSYLPDQTPKEYLLSSSKDTYLKIWDLETQHCVETLVGHRSEVWSFGLVGWRGQRPGRSGRIDEGRSLDAETQTTVDGEEKKKKKKKEKGKGKEDQVQAVGQTTEESGGGGDEEDALILISGGGEGELRIWKLDLKVLRGGLESRRIAPAPGGPSQTQNGESLTEGGGAGKLLRAATYLSPLNLSLTVPGSTNASDPNPTPSTSSHLHRINQISFHFPQTDRPTDSTLLAIQVSDKAVEVLRFRSEEEMRKREARRKRREREKTKTKTKGGKGKDGGMDVDADADGEDGEGQGEEKEWRSRLASWLVVRTQAKIRSFDFGVGTGKLRGDVHIMTALTNNSVDLFSIPSLSTATPATPPTPVRLSSLLLPGHRTDVRALSVSSDDELLASASNGSLKIWNLKTTKCLRTLECGYGICLTWLMGDRHVVVGTKSGLLQLYDIASSTLLEEVQAHTGPIWSLQARPDGKGLITGSADKDVKFWEFEIREVEGERDEVEGEAEVEEGGDNTDGTTKPKTKVLTMIHVKTLKMTDDVLSVRYSPDGRLLAVSLLDSTVKIFYSDTLKFFLSLYGHKLPVLSMDISSDSKLIATCSADKNVKIWGLDFGDCHRSLFAHEESIMQVAFEKKSHLFWTVGKDRMVKYWDGDKFQNIQKLEGHHGEVWALAVSNKGKFVVTASHDKSIRIWEKLDEQLFLEEERERQLEQLYDSNLLASSDDPTVNVKEVSGPEATDVTKSTAETLMAGERIVEAIELADVDRDLIKDWEQTRKGMDESEREKLPLPARNPVIVAYGGFRGEASPEAYVMKVVMKVPASNLHDALLVLPFVKVASLLEYLDLWAMRRWNITLTSRILFFLVKTHHNQIVATQTLRPTLLSVRKHIRDALQQQKDMIGFNIAALKHIERQIRAARTAEFYEDEVTKGGKEAPTFEETEERVRLRIEESLVKKRKRAALRS